MRSLNMRSSASLFWNPKEKFHFEFFEKRSHSIELRMIDLLHFLQSSISTNRAAKKLFEHFLVFGK
ncbi:MAG: hypothetical protein WCG28_03420 [bacterium]